MIQFSNCYLAKVSSLIAPRYSSQGSNLHSKGIYAMCLNIDRSSFFLHTVRRPYIFPKAFPFKPVFSV